MASLADLVGCSPVQFLSGIIPTSFEIVSSIQPRPSRPAGRWNRPRLSNKDLRSPLRTTLAIRVECSKFLRHHSSGHFATAPPARSHTDSHRSTGFARPRAYPATILMATRTAAAHKRRDTTTAKAASNPSL
jgi:hypothetical protein